MHKKGLFAVVSILLLSTMAIFASGEQEAGKGEDFK